MRLLQKSIVKSGKSLRMGYTTGSCAAAAAKAAARLLLTGETMPGVKLETPSGVSLFLDLEESHLQNGSACCAVCKDGGDDPDVTSGARIVCTVTRLPCGIEIDGGNGVGRVTKPGLACAVGQAAINPVPRRMIAQQLGEVMAQCGYTGGLRVVVEVPEGERLAGQTFNPKMGIVGGISILGTTGIVEPMSESALVATICAEIDTYAAAGQSVLLIVPGNYGQKFAEETWGISLDSGVKSSNYIGETLDYARYRNFRRILLLGHAGKLIKLAAGIMNTHSRNADGRMEILAAHAALHGMNQNGIACLLDCVSVDAADAVLAAHHLADSVWESIAKKAAQHLSHRCGPEIEVAFAAFAARGIVMSNGNIPSMIEEMRNAQ